MSDPAVSARPRRRQARQSVARPVIKWTLTAVGLVIAILLIGPAAAVLLAPAGTSEAWIQRANVGDSFGVVNAVVSGLALAALIVTLGLQSRELALQRAELAMQRESLDQSRTELHRSAEASLRGLHVQLIQMSLDDESLAAVWPSVAPGLSRAKERQILYANLIFQHVWLSLRIADYMDERTVQDRLRYLFTSQLMRESWRAGTKGRVFLVPGSPEYLFAEAAEKICTEYEDLVAAARANGQAPEGEPATEWQHINSNGGTPRVI